MCFHCLGEGHLGQYCNRTRVCGQDGCKEVHHRLLHRDQDRSQSNEMRSNQNEKDDKATKKEDNFGEKSGSVKTKSSTEAEKKLNEKKVEQNDMTMVTETTYR